MPEVKITIGGREFEVSCQTGEEHYLKSAASLLDGEAAALNSQIGRLPASRMLLMSGLMLADKTARIEDKLQTLEEKLASQKALIGELRAKPAPEPQTVEVEVIPESLSDSMAEIAARTEALAAAIEEKANG
ncbi:cell division protein ZapA [Rhodobacteraceae bacterium R_SAG10]|nr:cell division protein ZapA [Rhodobacteraceae bacterium R_SAG10]